VRSLALLVTLIMVAAGAQGATGHPSGSFLTVHGATLWTESEGQGEPLVLIAGGPGLSHDYFHPYFSGLARSFRIIYFDGLGRGRSERAKSPADYSFARDVEDLEGLRKALGLTRIHLLGHSYGALVAQAYAARYPATTGKLVLVNGVFTGKMWQTSTERRNQAIRKQLPAVWAELQALRARGLRSSSSEYQSVYRLPPGFYFHHDDPAHKLLPLGIEPSVYYAIAGDDSDLVIGKDVAQLDFRKTLKSLRTPILIMAGRYDGIAPLEFSQQMKKAIPTVKVVTFEDSSHYIFIEETQRALEVLRKFLGK
jgi:proline iminopeptidase